MAGAGTLELGLELPVRHLLSQESVPFDEHEILPFVRVNRGDVACVFCPVLKHDERM